MASADLAAPGKGKTPADLERYRRNRQEELDSAAQYRAMAESEVHAGTADVYRRLAAVEEKHAAFWEQRLRDAGVVPGPYRPSFRARTLAWLARRFGAQVVLPTVFAGEYSQRNDYVPQVETRQTSMAAEERTHARVLGNVLARSHGVQGGALARLEGRHRNVGGNALRAAVLGANDGLSSNLSLVMGVAGAAVDSRTILVTGLAGLLAGAFSMALGEWVSVQSARELAERELAIEKSELTDNPDEEREELALIYESKGLGAKEAGELSRTLMQDSEMALDVLSREELGIDPSELGGSPWTAAFTSFFLFAIGAIVPVAPFVFLDGRAATVTSFGASALGLFSIGVAISIFTGRSPWWSCTRQLLLGAVAAVATYALGSAIGVAIAG
jgi:VIT1/CCC1 family predicted Fe2+/Mn2+ transporter